MSKGPAPPPAPAAAPKAPWRDPPAGVNLEMPNQVGPHTESYQRETVRRLHEGGELRFTHTHPARQ